MTAEDEHAEPMTLMRAGRKLSHTQGLCTVYAVTGGDWEAHVCVGIMANPEIAAAVCDAVNARGVPLPVAPPAGED